tara:strand:- start:380 stop:667 length:288 start_codon:yes stop_codon:yes gene_type:complete
MSKLNIKLSISDRLYPMKVDASDEEIMRKSSQKINTIIKDFSEKYAVKDNQDLLAMCALSLSVQLEKKIKKDFDNEEGLVQKLTLIDEKLSNALK